MGDGGPPSRRPALRPPVGLPAPRQRGWRAALVSVGLHVLVALLLLIPAIAALIVHVNTVSAGGRGARGGGGGSVLGGYIREGLRYVETPRPAPSAPPRPVPKPPQPKPPPAPPPPTSAVPVHDSSAVAQAPGNGAGRDEMGGGGPGTGGGTGTGTGAGTGNATGPGAGGSAAVTKIHAATDVMTLATIDPPSRPRPFHLHAVFAVDVRGNARLLTVNKADDGDFNRAMHDRLLETHFKAATLPNGTPVADTVSVDIDY